MGLGGNKREPRIIKDFLYALSKGTCQPNVPTACTIADQASFVVEDGMLSMYPIITGANNAEDMRNRAREYAQNLSAKHPSAQCIVLSMDDTQKVPVSKRMEQLSRDANAFTPEEIETLGTDIYLSCMDANMETSIPTMPAWISHKSTARTKKNLNRPEASFRWYTNRFMATRQFKPDAIMMVMMGVMKEHAHALHCQDTRESIGCMILDGVPWAFDASEVASWPLEDEHLNWDSLDFGVYMGQPIDGSWMCPKVTPLPFKWDHLADRYHGVLCKVGQTAMIKLTPHGAFFLPHAWRTGLGEADTKLGEWIRRFVIHEIRTPDAEKTEELPVIWATSLDTDSLVILLLLLDELYDHDPANVDFRLYLDTTYASHPYRPYYGLSGVPSAIEQEEAMRKYKTRFRSGKMSKCQEVWDMTCLWLCLREFLDKLPHANPRTILKAFLTMLVSRGTDFVTPIYDVPLEAWTRTFFAGGYMFLQKGIRACIEQTREDMETPPPDEETTIKCQSFRCNGECTQWTQKYPRMRWKMNDEYVKDFVRMVLFNHLRSSPIRIPSKYDTSDDMKLLESKYMKKIGRLGEHAKNVRTQNGRVHTIIADILYTSAHPKRSPSGKISPEAQQALLANHIKQLDICRRRVANKYERLYAVAVELATRAVTTEKTPHEMRTFLRKTIPNGEELQNFYARWKRSNTSNGKRKRSCDPSDAKACFRARDVTPENVETFARVVHYQLYYWTNGTQKGFRDASTARDKRQRKSIAGFTKDKKTGVVTYANNVCVY